MEHVWSIGGMMDGWKEHHEWLGTESIDGISPHHHFKQLYLTGKCVPDASPSIENES